jgi:hypothetical protein
MSCSDCGATDRTILLTFEQRIGKRLVSWVQCRPCWAKEEARHA